MAQQAKKGNSQLKRLLGNKNTVTLFGILICIGTLIVGYNYRINKAIDPSTIPYAKESIPARTFITSKMIGNIKYHLTMLMLLLT
jgi:dipeptide/tripeptide permease